VGADRAAVHLTGTGDTIGKPINVAELRRQYELEPARCVRQLLENVSPGPDGRPPRIRFEQLSIRDLFEALTPGGRELLYEISFRRSGGNRQALTEAAQAVSTGDFSNIVGQIVYNRIREAYENPTLLWSQLCTTQSTDFLNGERIPEVGGSGDKVEKVEEGALYPTFGLNEAWLDTKPTVKYGGIIPITREIVVADRTGLVGKYAAEVGYGAGVHKEKEVVDVATGQINNYNRNGVSTNTYLTAGAYINDTTGNALDGSANEWRAIEKADLLFDSMTNPNTGEPIGIPASPQLLVPSALLKTAERIVHATAVQTVDMRAQTTTVRTEGGNPLGTRRPQILSNQYVKARTSSTTKWYYGDFRAAILYMSVWEIETLQAAANSEPEFTQDIWARHKVSYRGVCQMYEPRKLTRNDT
jgi:hypothetical protein